MAHDVFISYSIKDKPTADAICAALEGKGIRCWIAPRDVLPTENYGGAIVTAIRQSRVFVLVFSTNSNNSDDVMREVERAVSREIPVLPFRVENVLPSPDLEYFISASHWLDALTPPLEQHINVLAETVKRILSTEEPRSSSDASAQQPGATLPAQPPLQPATAPPSSTIDSFSRRLIVPGVGIALILAAVLLFMWLRRPPRTTDANTNATQQGAKSYAQDYRDAQRMLGSSNMQERLNGIQILERILSESDAEYWRVITMLTDHVTANARWTASDSRSPDAIPLDIQQCMNVIGKRPVVYLTEEDKKTKRINLRGTDLRGLVLKGGAYLQGADLEGAHLEFANLREIHLEDAVLKNGSLESAILYGAFLENADLAGTCLRGADMQAAQGIYPDTIGVAREWWRAKFSGDFLQQAKEENKGESLAGNQCK
jgi:hypothetical protein